MIDIVRQIRERMADDSLGASLRKVKQLCRDYHFSGRLAEVEAIENDYSLMCGFYLNGCEDTERVKVHRQLKRRLLRIVNRITVDATANINPTFMASRKAAQKKELDYASIEETLSSFDQELTLASLDSDAEAKQKEIHVRMYDYRVFLFNYIFTSNPWTESEADTMAALILSPLVDDIDKQIVISAMFLSLQLVADVWKFNTLCRVVMESDNVYAAQHALVAVALSLPDDVEMEVSNDAVAPLYKLLEKDSVKQTLYELQIQILMCLDTAKNEREINDEIIPTLMKNSKTIVDPSADGKTDIDALLNPPREEEDMEKMEGAIERMREMQKKGADIFFGGFAKAKRFSFFYTLMNWFCPFYIENPRLQGKSMDAMPMTFLKRITDGHAFCDSDKYSFVLSMLQVFSQLPKNMVEMMNKGELAPAFEQDGGNKPALVRRAYLNDLYRFFNLYSDKSHFTNPFEKTDDICFFLNKTIAPYFKATPYPIKMIRQLMRREHYAQAEKCLEIYDDNRDAEYYKLLGLANEKAYRIGAALTCYEEAYRQQPDNAVLVERMINCAYKNDSFDTASALYDRYVALTDNEENESVENIMAQCYLRSRTHDKAQAVLFRLSYHHPENIGYRKMIALCYFCQGKFEKVLEVYDALSSDDLDQKSSICKVLALWKQHRVKEAVEVLRDCRKAMDGDDMVNEMQCALANVQGLVKDETLNTELSILADLVSAND